MKSIENVISKVTPPPFLLGCTLLFWGWQSHLLLFAIPIALILEMAHWIKWRWVLLDKDFNRVTDLTSLSLLIATIYLFSRESTHGLMILLNWLPMLLFLLILAQTYSTHGTIKLSSLFLSLRHYESISQHKAEQRINLSYPYMMVCLLATSTSNAAWFFAGMYLLVGWGLWAIRPQRYPPIIFGLLLVIAGIFAYLSQLGLARFQTHLEELVVSWFEEMLWSNKDPYKQHTAIGDIGRLKLSDRIILRVDTPHPILLREASYNTYFKTTWRARKSSFTEVTLNPTFRT